MENLLQRIVETGVTISIIDITGKAIEETASDIMRVFKQRGLLRSLSDDDPLL